MVRDSSRSLSGTEKIALEEEENEWKNERVCVFVCVCVWLDTDYRREVACGCDLNKLINNNNDNNDKIIV